MYINKAVLLNIKTGFSSVLEYSENARSLGKKVDLLCRILKIIDRITQTIFPLMTSYK